ncbi:MAG: helix-turn-helix transcriptional regulator [Acholeplasmataceae bacterium]|nr:helix-turn-helix transcriptional regulator [Acholeplasmataceae bacterium]
MKETFGQRFQRLRKNKDLTQEDIANKLNISPRAVSKWENDITYPDITYLVELATILEVTVDYLLGKKNEEKTSFVGEKNSERKKNLILKIVVDSKDGDKVRVNLPLALFDLWIDTEIAIPQINNVSLKGIDFKEISRLIDSGVIGKLVEVETSDGDFVYISVE